MKTRSRKKRTVLLLLCAVFLVSCLSASAEEPAAPAGEQAQQEEPQAEQGEAEGEQPGETPEEGGEESGEQPEGGPPGGGGGGMPSGGPPGGGGGGGRGGGSSGITPGKALTSAHTRGSRTMLRYGAVVLTAETDSMQTLTLGGEELALSCGGYSFTATVEEDVLVLRSEEGDAWSLTMDVLKTLNLSGIRQLRLIGPDTETALDTDLELTGSLYGKERTLGFVSSDFLLTRREGEWLIQVDGREYRLSGNELC